LSGLKLVVDAANGAASGLAEDLFERLGARVVAIASSPDGLNINADCGATAPQTLAEQVRSTGADAGVALDGDADRCILVDERGTILDGDDILLIWARQLHEERLLEGSQVVATVMSNFGLERALTGDGIALVRCQVGDRWVWETMTATGAALGGEQSGHVICSHHGVSGDGLLTASHVLAVSARQRTPLSELSDLRRMPQVLLNVPVRSKPPMDGLPEVHRGLDQTERRLAGRGRVLLRYSGTEPLARVMIEGDDASEIQSLAEELADAIRREIG
jgi:phosphoglucosamine mutase